MIGADTAIGQQVMANLSAGGFRGRVMAADTAAGIAALAMAPDLAIIATPPARDVLQALARKGTFAAVVLCDAEGLAEPANWCGVRILGPGSFGIAVPSIGLNASRAHLPLPAGRIGLVSQSASLCRTVLDWAQPNGVGFSHVVGMGGRADIGFGVVLDWLSRDPGTGTILLDIRQLRNRRAFVSSARAASRLRPVVAIGAGITLADRTGVAERAFQAALRRAGVLCVSTLEDLLVAAETLARARPARSEALAIVTNAITPGRMAADAALRDGLQLASDIVHVEPDASDQLAALASATGAAEGVGGVLVVHGPSSGDNSVAALTACRDRLKVPLLVCAMGETTGAQHRKSLAEAGMAVFATPEQAVRGFQHLVQDRRNRAAARELPPREVLTVTPNRQAVRSVTREMRRAGRLTAMQDEALAVLSAYGIPVVPTRVIASPDDAVEAASLLGFPAVVKLRQAVRPSERASGGLALDLHDAAEVSRAAQRLLARSDGPIISFGQGGTTADIVGDVSADLPPLNLPLAHALIARTRAAATLARFRDNPAANEHAVAEALVRVSQLIVDFPEIAELELNPLIADTDGVIAGDAWLRLRAAGEPGGGLAITPYPAELTEHWATPDGEHLLIRPIRPEDADAHGAFFARLSPQDIRYRFFTAMRELSPEQMARLTQIDYDREMAFIAVREASGETLGVARLVCEGDSEGEFAIIVQADVKGKGVASHLMHRLIEWARVRGLATIVGQVLADNAPMLGLARHLGFTLRRMPEEPDVVEARLALG